jgi:hypothetical protein
MEGEQTPPFVKKVDPPAKVWVQTRKLLPLAWDLGPRRPDGFRIQGECAGLLFHWVPTEDGDWLGRVTYQLMTADEEWNVDVTHYVPSHLIRRRGFTRQDREPKRRTHG